MADEDSSSHSGTSTPAISNPSTPVLLSNPGTPRTPADNVTEVRATPPPMAVHTPLAVHSRPQQSSSPSVHGPSPNMLVSGHGGSALCLPQHINRAALPLVLPTGVASMHSLHMKDQLIPTLHAHHMKEQSMPSQTKYTQLLAVIEDMGRDIRPTYSGSKMSAERLKRGITHARILVRDCLMECERSARS